MMRCVLLERHASLTSACHLPHTTTPPPASRTHKWALGSLDTTPSSTVPSNVGSAGGGVGPRAGEGLRMWVRPAALLLLAACAAPQQDGDRTVLPEHTFAAPLLKEYWRGGVPYWRLFGHAVATKDEVRLTPAHPNRHGAVQNVVPMMMDHWEALCKFRIHSGSTSGAHGFALWFTKAPADGQGALWGQAADFEGIGLIFQTAASPKRGGPQITAVKRLAGEPLVEWDIADDLQKTQTFNCKQYLRGGKAVRKPHSVLLRYRWNKLEVLYRKAGDYRNTYCGVIKDLALPPGYFFSLSAVTGEKWDNHDIVSFDVTAAPNVDPKQKRDLHKFDPAKDKMLQERHDGAVEDG